MRRALITGITGQDGSYLAELLLEKGYEVHGLVRSPVSPDSPLPRSRLILHPGKIEDEASLRLTVSEAAPDEIYHLAGPSRVGQSFTEMENVCEVVSLGTLRLLKVVQESAPTARFFHASSSEVFGRPECSSQDEQTPFRPRTPYGCAKTFATHLVSFYRQSLGLFAVNGILFNHESPRRDSYFVTQKICRAAAAIRQGRQQELLLGNLEARRDWGDARDFVRGMWLALQHPAAEDFIFATGELHSIGDVVEVAFGVVGLNWRDHVRHDASLLRPTEPGWLIGNPAKARRLLGWECQRSFRELIEEMTRAALQPG
jgi:GDPmannose 4,6-dehydratase